MLSFRMRFALLLVALVSAAPLPAEMRLQGVLHDPEIREISGIAPSRRSADLFWVHNDSFNPPMLFALNARGEVLARVRVQGAPNLDWEDLASFEEDGRAYLAIGDIGNNLLLNGEMNIYVLPEPALGDTVVEVARRYPFRFEDGPRDAEALALDTAQRRFVIAEKVPGGARLYGLPMEGGVTTASLIGELGSTSPEDLRPKQKLYPSRTAVTAVDLTPDGRRLLAATYRHLLVYEALPGQSWTAALARPVRWELLPQVGGFEAACWDAQGQSAYAINEGAWAHLYRWTP